MRNAVATLAVVLVAVTSQAASADAAPPGPGSLCGFASLASPFVEGGGRQVGEIDGGPIVIADGDDPRAGRIRCSIQVNGTGRHSDPDAASAISVTTPGVVVLPPTTVEYLADAADFVTVCTQVEIEGAGTFYWDDIAGEWSTSPEVTCWSLGPEPPIDPVQVDALVCPLLAALAIDAGPVLRIEPEGDLYVAGVFVWDCPPYDWN